MKFKKIIVSLLAVGAGASLVGCDSGDDVDYVNIEMVALVDGTDTSGATWDPVTATSEVERVLNTYGDEVDVVLSNNDGMALGIMMSETFQDADVPIFGVDALDDALTAITDGNIQGTIKNDSYTQANVVLQLVKNLLEDQDIETGITGSDGIDGVYDEYESATKAFRVHHQMVTADNVSEFTAPASVSANTVGADSETSDYKVWALTYNNADPNMSGLWKPGFNDFGQELNITVDWVDAANDETSAQNALDQAIATGGYDAYLINMVDQTNAATYLNKIDSDVPVILWNREASDNTIMADYDNAYYVGIESAEGGELQGQMAAEWFNAQLAAGVSIDELDKNGDGKIGFIVVRGEKGHADAEARTVASPANLDAYLTIFS